MWATGWHQWFFLQSWLSVGVCSCAVWGPIQTGQWWMCRGQTLGVLQKRTGSAASEPGWTFWTGAGSSSSAGTFWWVCRLDHHFRSWNTVDPRNLKPSQQTECCSVWWCGVGGLLLKTTVISTMLSLFSPRSVWLCVMEVLWSDRCCNAWPEVGCKHWPELRRKTPVVDKMVSRWGVHVSLTLWHLHLCSSGFRLSSFSLIATLHGPLGVVGSPVKSLCLLCWEAATRERSLKSLLSQF